MDALMSGTPTHCHVDCADEGKGIVAIVVVLVYLDYGTPRASLLNDIIYDGRQIELRCVRVEELLQESLEGVVVDLRGRYKVKVDVDEAWRCRRVRVRAIVGDGLYGCLALD